MTARLIAFPGQSLPKTKRRKKPSKRKRDSERIAEAVKHLSAALELPVKLNLSIISACLALGYDPNQKR